MNYLSTQLGELGIAYLLSAAGMAVALWWSRADRRAYFRLPAYSVMALALGVMAWNALRRHVFPDEWPITHAAFLYWGALAIYVLLGLSLGLVLGRMTRRREEPRDPRQDGGDHENH